MIGTGEFLAVAGLSASRHQRPIVGAARVTHPVMDDERLVRETVYGFRGVLAKPYRMADLRHAISQVIFEIDA